MLKELLRIEKISFKSSLILYESKYFFLSQLYVWRIIWKIWSCVERVLSYICIYTHEGLNESEGHIVDIYNVFQLLVVANLILHTMIYEHDYDLRHLRDFINP